MFTENVIDQICGAKFQTAGHLFAVVLVLDDEDTTITAGSIVTVSVRLVRSSMEDLLGNEASLLNDDASGQKDVDDDVQEQLDEDQPEPVEVTEHDSDISRTAALQRILPPPRFSHNIFPLWDPLGLSSNIAGVF